jgi:transposase
MAMISLSQRTEIRRLYYAEHWKVGTIASSLGVHRDTVLGAIEAERFHARGGHPRARAVDVYVPFIRSVLEQYPRLRATRLHEMLVDRGYRGSLVHLRRTVKTLRPEPKTEAYLRLRVFAGEQAQVDWGSFGKVEIGKTTRALSCFVMVLSWSRAIHAVFMLDQTLESFLRGHVEAFSFFQGVPRVLLYDNLRSAVLDRRGEAIHFQPRLLELAAHYHFAPRPVAIARGNEKGRVERQIQYLRTSFFAARSFRDVTDLNAQFVRWREEIAHQRKVPGDESLTVGEALERERSSLIALPAHPFETDLVRSVRSGKTPYVRFDRNLYSIPHTLVRKPLTLIAGADTIRVLDDQREVARHVRSYGSGECLEDPAHIEALVEWKKNARELKGRDRLLAAVPETENLFKHLALRGETLGIHTARLLRLLDTYGPRELRLATRTALERDAFSTGSIAHLLDQRRRERGLTPPLEVHLPDDPRVRDLRVIPHSLEAYDALGQNPDDDPHA